MLAAYFRKPPGEKKIKVGHYRNKITGGTISIPTSVRCFKIKNGEVEAIVFEIEKTD